MNSKKFFVTTLFAIAGVIFAVVTFGLYLDNSISTDAIISVGVGSFVISLFPSSIGSMLHLWLSRRKIK